MIHIDEIWLPSQPMDMRVGIDSVIAQMVKGFGYVKPHCAYLFGNKRGHHMKVLMHDIRLKQVKFHWTQFHKDKTMVISPEQLRY